MFLEHLPVENRNYGWIEVICGSMFSGKTEELIRRLKRVEFANQSLLLVKPVVDDRFHKKNVVSHVGRSFEAQSVNSSDDILKLWQNERVVAIDEAQFLINNYRK
jgi:thymidine kinase